MTQDGEKEIVLGNKQLISLFFVVVALCGVFFALGYMIRGNTAKPVTANLEATSAATPGSSISPSPAPPQEESEPPRETAPDDGSAANPAVSDSSPVTAAQSTPAAAPAPTVQTKPALDAPVTPVTSESGATWLQVTALKRADADNLVKTLREQKFPAVVAESSKPDLFRVLVGPYHQVADVADAKVKLKALGFGNAFVQK